MLWNGTSITEHNRQPLAVTIIRLENSKRMANGTLRRYVVADKRKWTTSWDSVPDLTSLTVDGKEGGLFIENFYNTVQGAFALKLMPSSPVTLTTGTNLVTFSIPHKLNVGDTIQLGTITTTTGVLPDTTYYVKTVPSATTLTLSLTTPLAASVPATISLIGTGSAASLARSHTVMFTDFNKTIRERGPLGNECSIDISLEEV